MKVTFLMLILNSVCEIWHYATVILSADSSKGDRVRRGSENRREVQAAGMSASTEKANRWPYHNA